MQDSAYRRCHRDKFPQQCCCSGFFLPSLTALARSGRWHSMALSPAGALGTAADGLGERGSAKHIPSTGDTLPISSLSFWQGC